MKKNKTEERKEVLEIIKKEDQNKEFKSWPYLCYGGRNSLGPVTRPVGNIFYEEYLRMIEESKKAEEEK